MILLFPVSPEVPKRHRPTLWPGLVILLVLCIAYMESLSTIDADAEYTDSLQQILQKEARTKDGAKRIDTYLKLRPLLRITPSRDDWDVKRLLMANFVHGNTAHLGFNLIGAFAGMRICTTFMPFLCSLSIFMIAGSLGLLASLLVTPQISGYIPHLGASAGIFALMGTYYVYNFRYRTKYMFWFPSRHGQIALRTSWFFFFDVIMLEIILSAAQLFPNRADSLDHIAHVVGFAGGVILASWLRFFQRWPGFLQTRREFLYWTKLIIPRTRNTVSASCAAWLELLEINSYNDQLKLKLCEMLFSQQAYLSDAQVTGIISQFTPTFIRLHTDDVAACLKEVVANRRTLPPFWLRRTPYDSLIRVAKHMAYPVEEQHLLVQLIKEYRRVHPQGSDVDRKLELLMKKLQAVVPEATGSGANAVPKQVVMGGAASPSATSPTSPTSPTAPQKPKAPQELNERSVELPMPVAAAEKPGNASADNNPQEATRNLLLEMDTKPPKSKP